MYRWCQDTSCDEEDLPTLIHQLLFITTTINIRLSNIAYIFPDELINKTKTLVNIKILTMKFLRLYICLAMK